jgi:hypothetical protein
MGYVSTRDDTFSHIVADPIGRNIKFITIVFQSRATLAEAGIIEYITRLSIPGNY